MKNALTYTFLLFVTLFISATQVAAQEEASNMNKPWFVGGQVGLNANSQSEENIDDENKHFRFNISPAFGYQLNKHWIIGGLISYSYRKSEQIRDTYTNIRKANNYRVGAFSRYIFNPQNKLMVFLQPSFIYSIGTGETSRTDREEVYESDNNTFLLRLSPGLTYQISDRFRLITSLSGITYASSTFENNINPNKSQSNTFDINLGLSNLNIGAEFLF